jgi:hypothetical protein
MASLLWILFVFFGLPFLFLCTIVTLREELEKGTIKSKVLSYILIK